MKPQKFSKLIVPPAGAPEPTIEQVPQLNPAPKRPRRQAWKEKQAAGRNRTGKVIPLSANPKEMKQHMKELAKEAVAAVVAGSETIDPVVKERHAHMSSVVRAHILSYLGDDFDAARAEFAKELLANARKVAHYIMAHFEDYPPHVQAFVFTAMTDKSEMLNAKAAATARNAAVGHQVNVFMDGSVNREKLYAQLTGSAFQTEEKVVEPVQVTPAS